MACRVCSHPDVEVINSVTLSGAPGTGFLASTYGLTHDQLNWHKRRHLLGPTPAHPAAVSAHPILTSATEGLTPALSPAKTVQTGAQTLARERFLQAYGRSGNMMHACKQSGVPRSTVYRWQEHDDAFAAAFRDAAVRATEVLEREAWRRAKQGVAEPVYQHGKLVGTVTRYSDALLMFLLKARAPEKYRDRVDVQVGPVIKAVAGFDPADVL